LIVATAAYAAACAALHAAAFPAGDAWNTAVFAELLASPGVHTLIEEGGGLVLIRRAADEAEILTLGTEPTRRRQGVARRLLTAALEWAATSGATQVFLEVAESNAAARALYGAVGFKPCGRRRSYYGDGADALILRLTLQAADPGTE
jgi:ribosomal-protein-alanine N-acetyltransferase